MKSLKVLSITVSFLCAVAVSIAGPASGKPITVRVAAYNVEFSKSATPEQIGELLKPYQLDIIGFNEAPDGDWTDRVGRVLGMKYSFVGKISSANHKDKYKTILSKTPLEGTEEHKLTGRGWNPASTVRAVTEIDGVPFAFYSLHICKSGADDGHAYRLATEVLPKEATERIIVVGDYNNNIGDAAMNTVEGAGYKPTWEDLKIDVSSEFTYNAQNPKKSLGVIDHILYKDLPGVQITDGGIIEEEKPLSDHKPVWAEIVFPRELNDQWFRGNTHSHTTRSDGDAAPEVVAKWYHDRNYNFLIITDHNKFVDPETVQLPADKRDDFILIPGQEITGSKTIHTTAMNITGLAAWKYNDDEKSQIIQFHVDEAIKAGGAAVLNHPNFRYAVSAEDIRPVKDLYMFELFNGHPSVNNSGDHAHPSTEAIWDRLLSDGMKIFAVAADDAHHYHDISPGKANPGRGWVMVQAAELEADAITKAMLQGDFYTSTGVFLKTCKRGSNSYSVEVDAEKTRQEVASLPSISGKHVEDTSEGFRVEFIGPDGDILETIIGEKGYFKIDESIPYVRAKVTYTRKHPQKNGFEEYYAWGQPVFVDARAAKDVSNQ